MCAIFGLIDYEHRLTTRAKEKILKVLSKECEIRGTDATGFAFNHNGHISIFKRPLPARKMHLHLPDEVYAVMGHTRMATQGSEKKITIITRFRAGQVNSTLPLHTTVYCQMTNCYEKKKACLNHTFRQTVTSQFSFSKAQEVLISIQ